MNYLIIVPSIIIFFCIIKVFNSKRKQKISIETQNKIVPMINKKPIKKNTKKVNEGLVVLSRPNKCFSCEKQMLKHSATKNIHLAFKAYLLQRLPSYLYLCRSNGNSLLFRLDKRRHQGNFSGQPLVYDSPVCFSGNLGPCGQ